MTVHPDLKRAARFLPRGLIGPRTLPLLRKASVLARTKPITGVEVSEISAPPLRLYRPDSAKPRGPALLWIHGGGMVIGRASQDDRIVGPLARELGILIASVDYRLSPEHRYPAALDDCYEGLRWLHDQPDVDPGRIAIGGMSAGGGLAASLAQVALDRGGPPIAFQLLVYPMLDDRSAVGPVVGGRHHRLWNQRSNAFGWRSYLGEQPGTATISAPASPARRADLSGLPPAWIGVGTHDLFHDEDVAYAKRLVDAGVDCELEVVPGAFHGFDAIVGVPVSLAFRAAQVDALRRGLGLS